MIFDVDIVMWKYYMYCQSFRDLTFEFIEQPLICSVQLF